MRTLGPEPRPRGDGPLEYVDGLRAVAVLAVLACHALEGPTAPSPLAGTLASIGSRGVDLFFVISGFCLARPYLAAERRTGVLRIDYLAFLRRRFSRIAPPYYAALALFIVLSATSFGLPTAPGFVDGATRWREALLDAVFLTSRAPVHDESFWTLGIEMRWYLLCPLAIALLVRSRRAFAVTTLALWGIYAFAPWSDADLGMLPCFMLGIVAARLSLASLADARPLTILTLAALGIAVANARAGGADHGDPLWHIASFGIVACGGRAHMARVLAWPPLATIGRASFAIYLVHQPFVDWLGRHGVPWALAGLGGLLAGLVFWFGVERVVTHPAARVRIERALRGAGGPVLAPTVIERSTAPATS